PVIALDAGGPSLKGLWRAVGAAFALGAPVVPAALFARRFTRPFNLDWRPRFFVNPCGLAPPSEARPPAPPARPGRPRPAATGAAERDIRVLVRQRVAERGELPVSAVKDDDRLLGQLHLNSITVGQLVAEASRRVGLPPPVAPTDYAMATVAEVACALDELS